VAVAQPSNCGVDQNSDQISSNNFNIISNLNNSMSFIGDSTNPEIGQSFVSNQFLKVCHWLFFFIQWTASYTNFNIVVRFGLK
jgi:hypothetical protein